MLYKQAAITLRDHFSTVGPSPIASRPHDLSTLSAASNTAAEAHTQQPPSGRLLLLPQSPPTHRADDAGGRPTRTPFSTDVIAATAHRFAAFLAEAAVLVLVLGILDRFLASSRVEPRWIAGAVVIALCLLAASIATDVSARRWLSAH